MSYGGKDLDGFNFTPPNGLNNQAYECLKLGRKEKHVFSHSLMRRRPSSHLIATLASLISSVSQHGFVANCQSRKSGNLTVEEIISAENYWVFISQEDSFALEIAALKFQRPIPQRSCLLPLNPFLDLHGILRVGGREQYSDLKYSQKDPIVISGKHHLSRHSSDSAFYERCSVLSRYRSRPGRPSNNHRVTIRDGSGREDHFGKDRVSQVTAVLQYLSLRGCSQGSLFDGKTGDHTRALGSSKKSECGGAACQRFRVAPLQNIGSHHCCCGRRGGLQHPISSPVEECSLPALLYGQPYA